MSTRWAKILLGFAPLMLLDATYAAQINVTTTADEFGENAAACGLREAIQAANTHAAFGGCIAGDAGQTNTIALAPGTYILTRTGNFEDNNQSGDLDIVSPMNVQALSGGPEHVVIDGNGADRIFDIRGTVVVLNGLTLQNGQLNAALGGGGAVLVSNAHVDIERCMLQGNSAWGGGAVYATGAGAKLTLGHSSLVNNIALFGGAVFSDAASASVRATTISGNFSGSGGGGIEIDAGIVTINNATITNNEANHANDSPSNGGGGILVNSGTVNVSNTIIAYNRSHAWLKPDCEGTLNRFDFSLVSDSTGCNFPAATTGSLFDRDPSLAPLFDYGGHTLSQHPRYNSQAINAGSNGAIVGDNCETLDQRYKASQGRCGMGAVQWNMDFVVNRYDDAVDSNPGDGICDAFPFGGCTLRAAIMETNATLGTNAFRSILLPAQPITLSIAGRGEDADASGDLDLHLQTNIFGTIPSLPITHASVDANGIDRVFDIDTTAALVDFTVRGGDPGPSAKFIDGGGGIRVLPNATEGANVLLSHFAVTDSTASVGGGVSVYGFAGTSPSRLRVDHCAIARNSATDSFLGGGGGLYVGDDTEVVVSNCTLGENAAAYEGGGILNSGGNLGVYNSTIAFNRSNTGFEQYTADNSGGGISSWILTTVLANVILADNWGGRFGGGYAPSDCLYDFNVLEQNLVKTPGAVNCTFVPLVNGGSMPIVADPQLVQGYYGGTLYPLMPGSPAYGAVPNDECRGEITWPNLSPPVAKLQLDDQGGNARPAGGLLPVACSIGAYERIDPDHIFADGFQSP